MISLAAVLIVRDEQANLATCLASLKDVVDAVYVHDTGSTDDTVAIARSAGAVVTYGEWTNDFAAARNRALENCTHDWVLSIDADETLVVAGELRPELDGADAFDILIHVEHDELPYTFHARRLFHRETARWEGRVHEQIVAKSGVLRVEQLSTDVLSIVHSGYSSVSSRQASAQRNADIARAVVDAGSADARIHLDLGRSYVTLKRNQDAADAFETVREQFPRTLEWTEATDFLARLVLAEAMYPETLGLTDQLREVGVSPAYCNWLEAQVRVQLGEFDRAGALLESVEEVVDSAGRVQSPDALTELKSIVARLRKLNRRAR